MSSKIYSFSFFLMFSIIMFSQEDTRPNFLIILADDLGYGDLGFTGAKDIFTPNIDRLAKQGVEFTNGYVTHPYCGPSRAGLITGRYQARFGLEINVTNSHFDEYSGLPTTEKTFASRLQKAGYTTGAIGKWHLGASYPFHPNNRGFDYFYGFLSGGHSYFPENVDTARSLRVKEDLNNPPHYSANEGSYWPLLRNNKGGEFNEYLTTALSKDAAKFVSQPSDKPFMLYLAYNAPHSPLEAPKETIEKYAHIKNKFRRTYAAMIDEMDQGIGLVIEALEKTGKLENTVIFFLSDNGGAKGQMDNKTGKRSVYNSSGPYRDGKGSMREGGSHVPFIIHWPAGIKRTGKFDGLVSSLDIAATTTYLGKGDTSGYPLEGKNLIPYLNSEKQESPHQELFWRTEIGRWSVRNLDTKYLLNNETGIPELYDMKNDPYETTDILSKSPKERKKMAKSWNDWNKENTNNVLLQANAYQKRRLKFYKDLHESLEEKAKKKPVMVIE